MIRTIERAHEWPATSTDFGRKNPTRKTGTPGRRSSPIVPATLASNSTWCHAVASAPSAPHWWRCPEQADGCGCLLLDHLTRRPSWRFPDPCRHGYIGRSLLYPKALAQKGIVMARRRQLYEGKAKILFEGPEPGTLVQYFKD